MSKTRVIVFVLVALLMMLVPLGACTREVVKEVPVEKTVVQTQPVEKTVVQTQTIEKTVVPEIKLPAITTIYSHGSTTSAFTQAVAIADAMTQQNVKSRVAPSGTDSGRLLPVRAQEAQLIFSTQATTFMASHALSGFEEELWGPQQIYQVWLGWPVQAGMVARADMGIKTMADLKGKRIPYILGSATANAGNEAMMAFAGLTWDDVVRVDYPSVGEAQNALIAGLVDADVGGVTASWVYQLQSSPRGLYFIPMPASDTEGWKRAQLVSPYMVPITARTGAGITDANPYEGWGYPYHIATYAWLPDDWAYTYAKLIDEGYPLFKDKQSQLVNWTLDTAVGDFDYVRTVAAPYHPGTIKYFKEIGKWTAELQAWQEERLMLQDEIAKAWAAAPAAAKAAGVTQYGAGWTDFWSKFLNDWLDTIQVKYSLIK